MAAELNIQPIRKTDLEDPDLLVLNQALEQIKQVTDYLRGRNGPVTIEDAIDLNGNELTNVGSAKTGSTLAAQVQKELEVGGSAALKSYRQLNNPLQRERNSSFLALMPALSPNANNSTLAVTNNMDGTTTMDLTAGFVELSASLKTYYPHRSDTITNPVGDVYYYYYLRLSDKSVQLDGPYTADTDQNRLKSNLDGNVMIARAVVNPAGGGTGVAGASGIL